MKIHYCYYFLLCWGFIAVCTQYLVAICSLLIAVASLVA